MASELEQKLSDLGIELSGDYHADVNALLEVIQNRPQTPSDRKKDEVIRMLDEENERLKDRERGLESKVGTFNEINSNADEPGDRTVWYFMNDGEDNLHSLVSSVVVALRADELRAIAGMPPADELMAAGYVSTDTIDQEGRFTGTPVINPVAAIGRVPVFLTPRAPESVLKEVAWEWYLSGADSRDATRWNDDFEGRAREEFDKEWLESLANTRYRYAPLVMAENTGEKHVQ